MSWGEIPGPGRLFPLPINAPHRQQMVNGGRGWGLAERFAHKTSARGAYGQPTTGLASVPLFPTTWRSDGVVPFC